jgi:hypothetical protein
MRRKNIKVHLNNSYLLELKKLYPFFGANGILYLYYFSCFKSQYCKLPPDFWEKIENEFYEFEKEFKETKEKSIIYFVVNEKLFSYCKKQTNFRLNRKIKTNAKFVRFIIFALNKLYS